MIAQVWKLKTSCKSVKKSHLPADRWKSHFRTIFILKAVHQSNKTPCKPVRHPTSLCLMILFYSQDIRQPCWAQTSLFFTKNSDALYRSAQETNNQAKERLQRITFHRLIYCLHLVFSSYWWSFMFLGWNENIMRKWKCYMIYNRSKQHCWTHNI